MTGNRMGWVLSALMFILFSAVVALLWHPAGLFFTGKRADATVTGFATSGSLKAPVVQFGASNGRTIQTGSRNYSEAPDLKVGDDVVVIYNASNPKDVELLLWREFAIAGIVTGFMILVFLIWLSAFLVSPESGFDDPLHIISSIVVKFHMSPWHFPLFFILTCTIISTGLGAYFCLKSALELSDNGIKVTGYVTETTWATARSNQNGALINSSPFAVISYKDMFGATHRIRRSLAKPFSRLGQGAAAEVIYPRSDPGRGIVNSWDELYLQPTFFTFMFVACSTLLLLILKKNIQVE